MTKYLRTPCSILCSFFLANQAFANDSTTVYKKTLPDGSVVFSDQAQPGSETLQVKPVTTVPALKIETQTSTKREEEQEASSYSELSFLSPTNDSAQWSGNGTIPVTLELNPALKKGHTVALYLNQELKSQQASLSHTLTEIYRGTHQLRASVLDSRGKELIDTNITFTILRPSVNR